MIAVLITALGKFVSVNLLDIKLPYILLVTVFWVSYVIYRVRTHSGILTYWGFRKEGFGKTCKPLLGFALVVVAGFVIYAVYNDQLKLHWHLLAILLLYPLWGVVQQFLMMSLIAGNLKDGKFGLKTGWIILLTSVAFSAIHLPTVLLAIATFFLALVYSFLFLKHRNLWPLGLFHGWLGAFFYWLVLNRDSWIEVFGAG